MSSKNVLQTEQMGFLMRHGAAEPSRNQHEHGSRFAFPTLSAEPRTDRPPSAEYGGGKAGNSSRAADRRSAGGRIEGGGEGRADTAIIPSCLSVL